MERRGNFSEIIELVEPVVCEGEIELWLKSLEQRI